MKYTQVASMVAAVLMASGAQFSMAQQLQPEGEGNKATKDEVIQIRGVRQKLEQDGRLKDVIQKTEVLNAAMIENKNALSLSEAIQNEPGIRVSNECSMCGVKRVMLNGMKGEHSTILVDGLPTHTMISGYYAVDAIATTGVDAIEIARGAGASLIAPEAIGGTINIVTKEAYENTGDMEVAKGSHDFTAIKGSSTLVSEDSMTGVTLIFQYDKQDQEDHDDNKVSEAPFQENRSLTARVSHDFNESNNVQVRLSKVDSEVFGGPMLGDNAQSITAAIAGFDGVESEALFQDNDVRKQYIGKDWETTEWIKTERLESYVKWLTEMSDTVAAEFAYSYAQHDQDSFYEGIDYVADDKMHYARAKFDYELSDTHFLTFGLDNRSEQMRSNTEALQHLEAYISDSFDYDTTGLFVQDTWTPSDELEVAVALRLDKVKADFVDTKKPGVEIDETIAAPRLDLRYFHNDQLTSRFSTGRGYRAPLSFFETDHGILDAELGYQIEVTELERSLSATYSLSYESDTLTATFSAARSEVDNLAALDETETGVPVLTQLNERAAVTTIDLVTGFHISGNLLVNLSVENFIYDDVFKSSYAIAPVEERAGIEVNWTYQNLEVNWTTTWFGSRDLSDYGYEGYNILGDVGSAKTLSAGAFSSSNVKLKYQFNDSVSIYGGVSNLFGYTQIEEGDTPLFYDGNGGYDVAYIYGPLHGREFYVGFKYEM